MKKIVFYIIIFLPIIINAQSFTGGFEFVLPVADTTTYTFLPPFPVLPINENDFVTIDANGHFNVNNSPIRFWGGNLVGGGAFPDKSRAWFIAGRLRKMGFNLIRFHHIDNPWGSESLFEPGKSTRQLNPVTLDRLEYLIAEMKKNGIYINMNLNVSRTFNSLDGVPDADSLVEYGKGVTLFDPQLIILQQEYAAQLLSHVNPYTGLALANDPVLAMVETANENSLYRIWRDGNLKPFAEGGWLTIRHTQMLDSMWNKFLSDKYGTTSSLAAAWNEGMSSGSSFNQIKNGDFETGSLATDWRIETNADVALTMTKDLNNPYRGTTSAKIVVSKADGTAWHLQWKQIGLSIKKDSSYVIKFAGRADEERTINVAVMRDNSPWTFYSGSDFLLTPEWKEFTFSFKGPEENIGQARITFQFAGTGTYWFDDISLGNPDVKGLLDGESLEQKNLKRIDFLSSLQFSANRVKDMSAFYLKVQDDYYAMMKNYLVNFLGVKVPITGTNWNVGPADLIVQDKMDYIDNHAYWDHPQFPNTPWSSTDWLINNTSMTKSSGGGTIGDLFAGTASVNKPFTISEYNHAFPNRYQSEAPLFLTAYSSFHDADGIMFFDYNGGNDWTTDKVGSYFSIHRNNVLMSLMPSCAFAFRNNFISKANETLLINFSPDDINLFPKDDPGGWNSFSLYPKKLALVHSIRNNSFSSASTTDFSTFPAEPVNPYKSDTDEITYNTNGIISIVTPKFIGLSGFLDTFPDTEYGTLKLLNADGFGTLTWISLTDDTLKNSERSLITISTMIQNKGMIWNGTTTINNNWGTAPTEIFTLTVELELKLAADSITVFQLENFGFKTTKGKTYLPNASGNFQVEIDQKKSPTLWFGIEKYGDGNLTGVENDLGLPSEFNMLQNYPNPFNNSTRINYSVPVASHVDIKIYDLLGNLVRTVINEEKSPGYYSADWDGKDDTGNSIVTGVYFAKFAAGNFTNTKKIILLK